ncbi:MAG: hypothetical protein RLW62_09445, partial [Gammaproteobacteria bacterium]
MAAPALAADLPGLRDFTVADYLRIVAPGVPPALIERPALDAIVALAARLPGTLTSFCGFECPLGTATARADFLLCATREEGHAAVLAGRRADSALAPALLAAPAWQRARDFCAAWLDDDHLLRAQLMNTWLEFDVTSHAQALTAPSLFYGTHPPGADGHRADAVAVQRAALGVLAPAALEGARGRALEQFFAALPPGCHVFQVGVMWARETPALRLCLRHISAADLLTLLTRLAWPGPLDELAALLAVLAPAAARIDVGVDLDTDLGAKLGLECYPGTDAAAGARLAALTARLVAHGACTADKAAALATYQGLSLPATTTDWPACLSALAARQGRGLTSALCRWVHHLKVVLEPGQPLTAKAYLAVEHHLLARLIRPKTTMIQR